jgi:predicted metal-dependent enzyme (double-stranded beta helix superfamily)
MSQRLAEFVGQCRAASRGHGQAASCVAALAPLMSRLIAGSGDLLAPAHRRADPDHYARNPILIAPEGDLSLFAIVWTPGQWTPVHDHGSWGVVGILEGMLEEHNYIRVDRGAGDEGVDLRRGGVDLLSPGTVTSFVPNPDHIHMTGVPAAGTPTISLHLYGRTMSSFHVYDLEAGCRRLVDVPHNES